MQTLLEQSWQKVLATELDKPYFQTLANNIRNTYQTSEVFPAQDLIFAAFDYCPFSEVKVVILGQDPYHGSGQAHGLSFSVPPGIKIPPSLNNIYKELASDLGGAKPTSGDLTAWSKQGVLLLNATLTVLPDKPGSHQKLGWAEFTDAVIATISTKKENVVFILWGKSAQAKETLIDTKKHLVLAAPHPSPLSAYTGFFGSKPFSKTNAYLKQHHLPTINW
jgi:uracil-DNA glycosylase